MKERRFFATPEAFRAWMAEHYATENELWVGMYKVGSGRPSITWPEGVDVALCYGWIDGVRKTVDDVSYEIRFTPRKPRSNWSTVNIRRITALMEQGLVHPAGRLVFEKRVAGPSDVNGYEQSPTLDDAAEQQFRANEAAWAFFEARAPWYRRNAIRWVISAKRTETQQKRLATLIADSAAHRTISLLTRPTRSPLQ